MPCSKMCIKYIYKNTAYESKLEVFYLIFIADVICMM